MGKDLEGTNPSRFFILSLDFSVQMMYIGCVPEQKGNTMNMYEVMSEAITKANQAGREKLNELARSGPKFSVHNTGLSGECTPNNIVGTMLDVCGFAWLQADGNSPLVRALKKIGTKDDSTTINGNGWFLLKCSRGYHMSILTGNRRQEMSVNEAEVKAALEVLRTHGLADGVCSMSRID